MATIRVHTTQNVTLEYEVGSIGERIVAALIDIVVLIAWGVLWGVVTRYLMNNSGGESKPTDYGDPAQLIGVAIAVLFVFLVCAPFFFYSLACEAFFNGQTIGKKALNLRVVRLDGTSPRLGDYFLRWLLRLVDIWFGWGLIAVVAVAASGKGQRLGDMAAGTSVISTKQRASALHQVVSPLLPEGYQPVFAQAVNLSDRDVALVRQLLSRSLQHENYLVLNETANKIKQLLHVDSHLSDEAFLRTVLRDHAHLAAAE